MPEPIRSYLNVPRRPVTATRRCDELGVCQARGCGQCPDDVAPDACLPWWQADRPRRRSDAAIELITAAAWLASLAACVLLALRACAGGAA